MMADDVMITVLVMITNKMLIFLVEFDGYNADDSRCDRKRINDKNIYNSDIPLSVRKVSDNGSGGIYC